MAVYLKLDETMGDQHLSMRDDVMGLSLLALLLSLWAGLGLLAAVPKASQLLLPETPSVEHTLI